MLNFQLSEPGAVELTAHGLNWDLHNFVSLIAIRIDVLHNRIELIWRADAVPNPWGSRVNDAVGCMIRFTGISFFNGTLGSDMKFADTLSGICRLELPLPERPASRELRVLHPGDSREEFNLCFELGGDACIEIGATDANLIPIYQWDSVLFG